MRKGLAAFLAFLFLLLLPIGLLCLAGQSTFLNPSFLKSQLAKPDINDQVYALEIDVFSANREFARQIPFNSDEVKQLAREMVPQDYFRQQADVIIGGIAAWLNSSDISPRITLPLGEIKSRAPGAITAAAERKLAALPSCAPGVLPRLDVFPECIPAGLDPAALMALASPLISRIAQEEVRSWPDSITLDQMLDNDGRDGTQMRANLDNAKRAVSEFRLDSLLLYATLALLLAAVLLLTWMPFKTALKWVGVTLLTSGVLALLGFLAIDFLTSAVVDEALRAGIRGASGDAATLALTLISSMKAAFMQRLFVESGAVAALGLALLVLHRATPDS